MARTTIRTEDITDGEIFNAQINSAAAIDESKITGLLKAPTISGVTYPGSSTALNTAGGDSLVIAGTDYAGTMTCTIDGTSCSTVTVDSAIQVTVTTPAKGAGTYTNGLELVASNGLLAKTSVSYSGIPAWTTSAGEILSFTKLTATTVTVAATGDTPITYAVTAGALPGGLNLNTSTGVISGTGTDDPGTATSYTFTITATDAQTQTSPREFSIEVNVQSNYYGDGSDGALNT